MEVDHRSLIKPNLDFPCIGHPPDYINEASLEGEASNSFVYRALCLELGVQSHSTRQEVDLGERGKQEEAGGPLVGRPRPL
jgi:hypothetical protein